MTLHPMISALRKHKAGVTLIALQIALTLAIVCNAIFIIGQRVERVNRPTGLDEHNLLTVTQMWVGAPSDTEPGAADKLDAMLQEDLAALRAVPGVESVTAINSLPLANSSWNGGVSVKPGDNQMGNITTTYYFGDDQTLSTLGLKLVAGRAFTAADVDHMAIRDQRDMPIAIISQALADRLYPQGHAVGKPLYMNGSSTPTTIVGIVERLQAPGTGRWENTFTYNATLMPMRLNSTFSRYVIRTRPGQLDTVLRAVPPALYKVNPLRVIDDDGVKTFAQIRQQAYRGDVGMALLMGMICVILLAVTGAGIVGLTSFWVGQRTRQIGIRRALGATRSQIQRFFQAENFLIASLGIAIGLLLAFALNQLLMSKYELPRLPLLYLPAGALSLWLLGQLAVLGPARRAASVPPAIATRSA